MVMQTLTRLRHGRLKRVRFLWSILRPTYRAVFRFMPGLTASKRIGKYGPFKLNRRFAFSNFEAWGDNHNRGFEACIEAARGMTCVMDIGAHIGLVSLPLSTVITNNGTVYAFEPASANGAYLNEHLESNKVTNVKVVVDLVGDKELESVEFFESDDDSGMNTIAETGSRRGYGVTQKRQITLDNFCKENELKPELIKIDTEGAEVGILKGAAETLRTHHPTIYLSVHPRHIIELGSTVEELEQLLSDLDYKVTDMNGTVVRPLELTEYIVSPK
jgi:FkbM family methyltransferase